jgi:D-alanyl-D-alanine carboxypeptidase (penicillin-binding protein 5/6)
MRKTLLTLSAGLATFGWAFAATGADPRASAPPVEPQVQIAYLVDLSSGQVLHAREADRRFIPASITKVMTLYVAFEMLESGELSPEARFPMTDDLFRVWANRGSRMFIPANARPSVDELLHGIASVSANDGSMVLAVGATGSQEAWANRMNAAARKLGMHDSHFGTPNGWPDDGRTFTTAEDLAKLGRALVTEHPELYARYIGKPGFTYNAITQRNHDPITGVVEGADGIKTGFTNQAGFGFLGSAQRDGRRLMMVVAGSENPQARTRLARALIEWGFAAHQTKPLYPADQVIARAMVQDGDSLRVALVSEVPVHATVPQGARPELALTVHYDGPVRAPLRKGDKVAELEIAAAGQPPARLPLVAAHDVGPAGPFDRLLNGLAGLVR